MGKKQQFKVGDKARVCADWIRGKTLVVTVIGLQQNGNTTFAKVKWQGSDAIANAEKFGSLFTFDELRSM